MGDVEYWYTVAPVQCIECSHTVAPVQCTHTNTLTLTLIPTLSHSHQSHTITHRGSIWNVLPHTHSSHSRHFIGCCITILNSLSLMFSHTFILTLTHSHMSSHITQVISLTHSCHPCCSLTLSYSHTQVVTSHILCSNTLTYTYSLTRVVTHSLTQVISSHILCSHTLTHTLTHLVLPIIVIPVLLLTTPMLSLIFSRTPLTYSLIQVIPVVHSLTQKSTQHTPVTTLTLTHSLEWITHVIPDLLSYE